MNPADDTLHIVIAVTESSPMQELWQAAMQHLSDAPSELTVLFVADDRWRRAASLPFTREISRIGGTTADFTLQRAEQLAREAIARARRRTKQLAAETKLARAFRVLSEPDPRQLRQLVGTGPNVLIAPRFIERQPIYAHFVQLGCRIMLVDVTEDNRESE